MDYNTVSIFQKLVDCSQFDGKSAVFYGTFCGAIAANLGSVISVQSRIPA
jgi:hypothetical protein